MGVDARVRRITYKRAGFLNSDATLEDLLKAAFSQQELVDGRMYEPSPGGPDVRFINAASKVSGLLCGDYLAFERNRAAQLIKLVPNAKRLNVGSLAAHKVADNSEFLDSTLLWGVAGNHVLLIQSMGLRASDLERYLNWLLWKAEVLDEGDRLTLEDRPSATMRKATKGRQVKSIKIKMPMLDVAATLPATGSSSGRKKFTVSRSVAAEALAAFIGGDELSRLGIDNAVDANLQAELRLSYMRTTDEAGRKILNGVANVLGKLDTIDADDVQLEVDGIGKVKGSQLRLEKTVSLPARDGVINLNDAFVEMAKWLTMLAEQGLLED